MQLNSAVCMSEWSASGSQTLVAGDGARGTNRDTWRVKSRRGLGETYRQTRNYREKKKKKSCRMRRSLSARARKLRGPERIPRWRLTRVEGRNEKRIKSGVKIGGSDEKRADYRALCAFPLEVRWAALRDWGGPGSGGTAAGETEDRMGIRTGVEGM